MKKNLTKKLMLSVLTLAFAVVSLGASTFAWFTTSKEAKVNEFTLDVTAEAGIQIAVSAVDGSNKSNYYINELPAEVVKGILGQDFKFNNVSACNGEQVNVGSFYNISGGNADGGYVALKFYVKADASGTLTVNIPWLVNKTAGLMDAWAAGVEYHRETETVVIGATDAYKYDALSAARLAVAWENGATKYYEAVEDTTYQKDGSFGNTLGYSEYGALEVYNKFNNLDEDNDVDIKVEDTAVQYDADAAKYVVEIERNEEYELTYYIWIEGFDAECANAIFAQVLSAQISFEFEQTSKQIHYHVACPECGLCTDDNCDGEASEQCQGH